MTSSRNPRPIPCVARTAAGFVAIALCFGSSPAVALPPDAPLAGDERETPNGKRMIGVNAWCVADRSLPVEGETRNDGQLGQAA